jgi:hypothetical protein
MPSSPRPARAWPTGACSRSAVPRARGAPVAPPSTLGPLACQMGSRRAGRRSRRPRRP